MKWYDHLDFTRKWSYTQCCIFLIILFLLAICGTMVGIGALVSWILWN